MFASSRSPKKLLKDIVSITGSAPLPPIYSLGFHYSEWTDISADFIMNWDSEFEKYGIPVDVFWLDIEHSNKR